MVVSESAEHMYDFIAFDDFHGSFFPVANDTVFGSGVFLLTALADKLSELGCDEC